MAESSEQAEKVEGESYVLLLRHKGRAAILLGAGPFETAEDAEEFFNTEAGKAYPSCEIVRCMTPERYLER